MLAAAGAVLISLAVRQVVMVVVVVRYGMRMEPLEPLTWAAVVVVAATLAELNITVALVVPVL